MSSELVAATCAGIVTTLVGHPLDTIKVHLQTNPSLRSTWHATTVLIHNKALFRGILPPLINAVVMNTVMFSVFSGIKNGIGDESILPSGLVAGLVSGFVTACISTPTDGIKIQSQLTGLSTLQVLKSTSPASLFRGHVVNLAREGVFTMVYLGLYDQLRPRDSLSVWKVAATSSLTGGMAWIASYPFDTIKTVVQSSSHKINYQKALKQIGGHYYRGCGSSTGRAVMVTSLRMIVYESVMSTA